MSAEPKVKVLLAFQHDYDDLQIVECDDPRPCRAVEMCNGRPWRINPDDFDHELLVLAVYDALEARHARVREAAERFVEETGDAMSETRTCSECGGAGYIDNRDLCLGCAGTGLKTDKPREPSEADRLRAEVARLLGMVPSGGDQPLRCQVNNGAIVVCFGERILAAATECLSSLYDFENDRPLYRVTDPALFAKSVAAAMHDEGEDGSTPLTRFLESMIEEAIEQGGDGFEENPPLPGTETP